MSDAPSVASATAVVNAQATGRRIVGQAFPGRASALPLSSAPLAGASIARLDRPGADLDVVIQTLPASPLGPTLPGSFAMAARQRPLAVDLFAGVGGFSLGFEQAGFDVLAAVEREPLHARAYEYNFPHTAVLQADVATLDAPGVLDAAREGLRRHALAWGVPPEQALEIADRWDGALDVVFGGPPCQGFSIGGRRASDDARNDLVLDFALLVGELRPRYFVMENVPGLLESAHADRLAWVIGYLRHAGYEVPERPTVTNAAWHGVPQNRRRAFLIGWRDGERPVEFPAPTVRPVDDRLAAQLRRSHPPEFVDALLPGPTVRDAIGDLPNPESYDALFTSDTVRVEASAYGTPSAYAAQLRGHDRTTFAYTRSWDPLLLTASARTVHATDAVRRFAVTPAGVREPISRYLRLAWGGLSGTLRSGTGSDRGGHTPPRPIHPDGGRVITVREAARIHSFPDWFRFHVTRWHAWRQLGNSVPPALGRSIAGAIASSLGHVGRCPGITLASRSAELLGYVADDRADHGESDGIHRAPARARAQSHTRPTGRRRRTPQSQCTD